MGASDSRGRALVRRHSRKSEFESEVSLSDSAELSWFALPSLEAIVELRAEETGSIVVWALLAGGSSGTGICACPSLHSGNPLESAERGVEWD